jgi:hypothetical protein
MKEIELLDTDREVSFDEVKGYCVNNDMEVPAEGTQDYYDIVSEIQSWDIDDFKEDAALHFDLGQCLVAGYAGLWNGNAAGGKVMTIDSGADLFCMDVDRLRVVLEDDGLVLYGYHHDGTNRYVVRQLNERGKALVDKYGDEHTAEFHNRLRKLSRKVTKKMIGL